MMRRAEVALGVVAIGLMASSASAADVEPKLWSCSGEVRLNAGPAPCSTSPVQLKANDLIEVVRGSVLITGWNSERIVVEPGKAIRIEPRPAPLSSPSIFRQLKLVAELIFGGSERSALMKGTPHAGDAVVQPRLLVPQSLFVTEWSGMVHWQMPTDANLALRVRLPSGKLLGEPRLLTRPCVNLATLGVGDEEAITLELLLLDTLPEVMPNYLKLPTSVALQQSGRPVLAVVSTQLHRMTVEKKKQKLEKLLKDNPDVGPVERAALFLDAGELAQARDILEKVAPEGLPAAWALAVSGVRVEVAP